MTVVRYTVPEDVFYDHRLASDDDNYSTTTSAGINIKQQIREALANRERDYVLRLAAEYEQLIHGQGMHVKSTTFTPYQRFLVYCCSVYYKLAFGVDYITLEIFIVRTPTSQIPALRIADLMLVPLPQELSAANQLLALKPTTPRQQAFPTAQIDSYIAPKTSASSQHSSPPVTQPPTPIAQLSQPSIVIHAPTQRAMTFAERQAAYEEARRRIFVPGAEENLTDDDGNSDSRSSSGETDVLRLAERDPTSPNRESINKANPFNAVRGTSTKKVRFQPDIMTTRIINWEKHISPQIPETPAPTENIRSYAEDLDSTSFLQQIPNQTPNISKENPDLKQALTFPIISGRNGPASSESGSSRNSSPAVQLAQPPIVIHAPPKRMTLAERQSAYEEARSRIFMSYREEEDLTVHEGNSDIHSIAGDANGSRSTETGSTFSQGAKNAAYDPNPVRSSAKTVRFQPASDTYRITRGGKNIISPIPETPLPASSILSNEDDLESETASMSGTGSIYSYASSRTRSTDYGLRYTSRALAEEDIDTISRDGFWAKLPV